MLCYGIGDFLISVARNEDLKRNLFSIGQVSKADPTQPVLYELLCQFIKHHSLVKELSKRPQIIPAMLK